MYSSNSYLIIYDAMSSKQSIHNRIPIVSTLYLSGNFVLQWYYGDLLRTLGGSLHNYSGCTPLVHWRLGWYSPLTPWRLNYLHYWYSCCTPVVLWLPLPAKYQGLGQWCSQDLPEWESRPPRRIKWGRKWRKFNGKWEKIQENEERLRDILILPTLGWEAGYGPGSGSDFFPFIL